VLSRFDLLVDLPRHSLALTPNARFSDPFEADMSGVLLLSGDADRRSGQSPRNLVGHTYTVAGIAEESPASEAGLQAGDRLVAIADRDTRDMTMEMIRGILKSGPGTKVMVGVDRSGKKLQLVLTLRRAL
jgi:C-terminal processing protease CtpA/Prc